MEITSVLLTKDDLELIISALHGVDRGEIEIKELIEALEKDIKILKGWTD